jgi:hypothetical protein
METVDEGENVICTMRELGKRTTRRRCVGGGRGEEGRKRRRKRRKRKVIKELLSRHTTWLRM